MSDTPLTVIRFKEVMPQFSGITSQADVMLLQELTLANVIVCYSKWGVKYEMGRALLAAHYLSQYLEILEEAEEFPESAGGTEMVSPSISQEKVGEVEIRFRSSSASMRNNGSNENNDPMSQDMQSTLYGRRYLALLRSLGCILTTTANTYL